MEWYEIQKCLESFEILIDKREQPSERANKRYSQFECPFRRVTLNYCDYTYNFRLPNGSMLYDYDQTIKADAAIERKMSLVELSGNFTRGRENFKEEFERAKENNASIYLLVEDATWENLIYGRYKTKFNSNSFFASITAFMARYQIKPIFCKSEISGKMIKQILYRELKERLERGDYG